MQPNYCSVLNLPGYLACTAKRILERLRIQTSSFEKKPLQFRQEIWIKVVVILLQLYLNTKINKHSPSELIRTHCDPVWLCKDWGKRGFLKRFCRKHGQSQFFMDSYTFLPFTWIRLNSTYCFRYVTHCLQSLVPTWAMAHTKSLDR